MECSIVTMINRIVTMDYAIVTMDCAIVTMTQSIVTKNKQHLKVVFHEIPTVTNGKY